jgi:peptidoglycan hydrolase-like protein with peptidoglycan-binding domain
MSAFRIVGLSLCVTGSLLAISDQAAAETYAYEIQLTHNSFGKRVFKGEIDTETGRFEEFAASGNARVHFTGSVSGDEVSVYGELLITGAWRFRPFSVSGSFAGPAFTDSVVVLSNTGTSARGSITITRPAAAVSAPPPAESNAATASPVVPAEPAAETVAPPPQPPQTAVVVPPAPEEPPLSRSQRMAIQRQLSVLGLYPSAIDGDFGPGTRKGIRAFQRDNGLDATGYLTDQTIALLDDRASAREQQRAAEQPAASAPPAPAPEPAIPSGPALTLPAQAATAAPAPPEPAQPAPPADDFSAVIATLEPIDETFVAVKPAKVRTVPKVTADVVETLGVGDRIDVLGRVPQEDWYVVARDGKPVGYVVVTQLEPETALAETRATAPQTPTASATVQTPPAAPAIAPELAALDFGRYHALVIGNNAYRSLPRLNTAVDDARAVAAVLERNYGFSVSLLTDATEEAVIGTLANLRRTLTPEDNFLIYYAGHGWYDEEAERGYWLPVDAVADNRSSWISNADITDMLKAIKAKHVLVVADSCYSGTLTRGLAIGGKSAGYIQDIVQRRARTVLTSGGLEPVLDAGGGGHSVFADAFLDALSGNAGIIDGESVYHRVKDQVVLNAEQTPEYSNIRLAGHDGGDFLFVRRR